MSDDKRKDVRQKVKITIEGLEVFAHHGLLPKEREISQPFVFDITLLLKRCAAAETDDIADTVDYAGVCDLVVSTATATSFNLLEKLATVVADAILANYPVVDKVKLRVCKTTPPISHSLSGVAVSLKRERE
jgi:dihydroneopterin aldolase